MARNRTSRFGVDEGLFESDKTREVQIEKEIGTTQGKKGQKLKRINMAFSDVNHYFITHEGRRNALSATAFVNKIIDKYREEYLREK